MSQYISFSHKPIGCGFLSLESRLVLQLSYMSMEVSWKKAMAPLTGLL
jgi:hypothetical protein